MRGSITIRTVQGLGAGETLWDTSLRGFGVRRQQGEAVYFIKYRFGGRQRWHTIGSHGPLTPAKARTEAQRLLGAVAGGRDPQAEKFAIRAAAADTLGRVAERYLAAARTRLRPRTFAEVERHLLVHWRPLHSISVHQLARRQVAERINELPPIAGARARAALSAMFTWSIREGLCEANPVTGTNRPIAKARDRVLSAAELRAVWHACGDDDFGRIVRLLILTGQRRDEVSKMRWAEVVDDVWTIPGERTKNHREHFVPLAPMALAILPERQDEFVFGRRNGFSGWSRAKARLDAACGVTGWRLHDLRRSVATGMAEIGVLPHVIEAVLNHVSGHRAGVAGVYNRARYEAEVRSALTQWADHVANIVGEAAARDRG